MFFFRAQHSARRACLYACRLFHARHAPPVRRHACHHVADAECYIQNIATGFALIFTPPSLFSRFDAAAPMPTMFTLPRFDIVHDANIVYGAARLPRERH